MQTKEKMYNANEFFIECIIFILAINLTKKLCTPQCTL